VRDASHDCDPYCVFNIFKDPEEREDLSANITLLHSLTSRYSALYNEPVNCHDKRGSKKGGRPPDDNYKVS
jgi:hypothetical protein